MLWSRWVELRGFEPLTPTLPGRTSAPLQAPSLLGYTHLPGHTWCSRLPLNAVPSSCPQIDPPELLHPKWCETSGSTSSIGRDPHLPQPARFT